MGETLSGVSANSGLSYSTSVEPRTGAPVNTAEQDFLAAAAVANLAASTAATVAAPSPVTAGRLAGAAGGAYAQSDNISQGTIDLTNALGMGPAMYNASQYAAAIDFGMLDAAQTANPNPAPAGTTQTDFGDPAAPAANGDTETSDVSGNDGSEPT